MQHQYTNKDSIFIELLLCYNNQWKEVDNVNIENSIFKKSILDVNKLEPYGFIKKENNYIYEENIMDDSFKVILIIKDKILSGKIIDLETDFVVGE